MPKEESKWGYLSEVHGHGMNEKEASDLAEDLAAGMLGTTLGLEVDPNKAWSEKEQVYKSSGLIIRTSNITQTARGKMDLWTTTVAIAMFLFDSELGPSDEPCAAMSAIQPANFGGLPPQYSGAADSRVAIVPVPYDGTSTWVKGADKGPAAILRASANLELYDIETDSQAYLRRHIYGRSGDGGPRSRRGWSDSVRRRVQGHLANRKLMVVVGGEHSVSVGAVQAHVDFIPA